MSPRHYGIIELLTQVGEANVGVQNLDGSIVNAQARRSRTTAVTAVTFLTDAITTDEVARGEGKVGLVVWFPSDLLAAARAALSAPKRPEAGHRCDTTTTLRLPASLCIGCGTAGDNLGPCATWQVGSNGRCAYCDHAFACHPDASALPATGADDEGLAQMFHEAYERLAPSFGYETRKASAKPWSEVPEQNRKLMTAVCAEIRTTLAVDGGEELAERVAVAIYDAMREHDPEGSRVPWVHLGNSDMQHEARRRARAALSARPATETDHAR